MYFITNTKLIIQAYLLTISGAWFGKFKFEIVIRVLCLYNWRDVIPVL